MSGQLFAQTVTGRVLVSAPLAPAAGVVAGRLAAPNSPLSLGNISFNGPRFESVLKPQVRVSAAPVLAAVGSRSRMPALSLYKEEAPQESGAVGETLSGLIESVKTPEEKPAGQVYSSGHSIMDRVLGFKTRKDSAVIGPVEGSVEGGRSRPLARPSAPAARETAVPAVEKVAEKASMFGLGAFSLAGTVASVHPLMAVVVYVTMVVPSLILHEMGHAKVAEILGDPKQREAGRLGFTPEALKTHFDLTNTLLLPAATLWASSGGMLLGAAKPLTINYGYFAHPIKDMAKVAIAGPVVHVALALAGAAAFGLAGAAGLGGVVLTALSLFAYYNVTLALINLLPIFPADANHILRAALYSVSPKLVTALDGFYVALGRFNRLPLWIAIAALSLTGVIKAVALAVTGAFLGHAVLSAAALGVCAAAVIVALRRRLI